jgi:hypothetical protein
MDYIDDSLVEKLWRDLDGQVSRQLIAGTITAIATGFEKATVTAFVPIFIRRQALEQLKGLQGSPSHVAAGSALADNE